MEGFCRGCLTKYDDSELLQYTEKNRRLFVYSTGLQVKRNDPFTFQLCKTCFLNMKTACKFKKQCRSSDKRFKNYMGLKDIGDPVDFCTFLKSSDDTLTFRLPMASGNSTPANHKCKDDDNESTCTSIRNFMTDILQGEEMPDTEARIIREVIEEEADVLDDSLDSHWLQDDISIDTDFRLDFSFSPFSTPRAIMNDHCYTPKRYTDQIKEDQINLNISNSENQVKVTNDFTNVFQNETVKQLCDFSVDEIDGIGKTKSKVDIPVLEFSKSQESLQNFYVPTINEKSLLSSEDVINASIKINGVDNKPCSIDKNLEEALKNEDNTEFSLDGLLASPPGYPRPSLASTPTIRNILFGEKLDLTPNNTSNTEGLCTDAFDNIDGDIEIFEEFFQNDTKEFDIEDIRNKLSINIGAKEEPISLDKIEVEEMSNSVSMDVSGDKKNMDEKKPIVKKVVTFVSNDESFDIDNDYCNLCSKKFKSPRALSIHLVKSHRVKIDKPKLPYKHRMKLCNYCGKGFAQNANLHRHMKTCSKPSQIFKCDICTIECTSEAKLARHMSTHNKNYVKKDTGKQLLCTMCGATFNRKSNYRLHLRRHTKSYSRTCVDCGKGFYRLSDLTVHMRLHTGERPLACSKCPKRFSRQDILVKHMRIHTAEKHYQCDYCNWKCKARYEIINHIKNSKKCLMKRGVLPKKVKKSRKKIKDDEKITEDVSIITTKTNNDAIKKLLELPFLETDMSN